MSTNHLVHDETVQNTNGHEWYEGVEECIYPGPDLLHKVFVANGTLTLEDQPTAFQTTQII